MLIEVIVGLFILLVAWLYFKEEDPMFKLLPGPPRLPIIGNTIQLLRIGPEGVLQKMIEYTKIYGDRYVFEVMGTKILHINSPDDMEIVLSHSKNIRKSLPYVFLSGWLGSGLLLSTGTHWHKRRKVLTPAFHFNILKNFSVVIEEKTKDLVQLLKEKKATVVNVLPVISDFTLFTICETAMGTKLDGDQTAATVEYKNAILEIGKLLLSRLTKVWLWIDIIFKNSSEGKRFLNSLDTARSFADNVIEERRVNRTENKEADVIGDTDLGTKRRLAMLDLLLEAEARGEINMEGIRDEVNTFMFEGHDTTAMAITFGLMLLADHDDVQERILEEVQSILKDPKRSPSMSELADMKYLEAVIKEILRLYPSAPFISRLTDEDFMLGDVLIKKGTTVDIHLYDLHHREDMFPDAEAFKPDRFIGTEMKHPFAYLPFSAGPRNCIGQRFAMQEMKTTFSKIIRNFKLVPKVKGARPRLVADIVLRPADPIYIKFVPRN